MGLPTHMSSTPGVLISYGDMLSPTVSHSGGEVSHLLAGQRAGLSLPLRTEVQLLEGPHLLQGPLFQLPNSASVLREISASASAPPGCHNVSLYQYGSGFVSSVFLVFCHFPFVLESAARHHKHDLT